MCGARRFFLSETYSILNLVIGSGSLPAVYFMGWGCTSVFIFGGMNMN